MTSKTKDITVTRATGGTFEKITVNSTFKQILWAFGVLHVVHLFLLVGYAIAVSNFGLWASIGMLAYAVILAKPPLRQLSRVPLVDIIFKKRDVNDWHRIFNAMTAMFLALSSAWLLARGKWPHQVEFGDGHYWFAGERYSYGMPALRFVLFTALFVAWMGRRYWRDVIWALRQELLLPSDREKTCKAPINPKGIPAPDGYEFEPASRGQGGGNAGFDVLPDPGSSTPSRGHVL